jgi:hypothetical protein
MADDGCSDVELSVGAIMSGESSVDKDRGFFRTAPDLYPGTQYTNIGDSGILGGSPVAVTGDATVFDCAEEGFFAFECD